MCEQHLRNSSGQLNDIRRDPPRLVFADQLGCCAPAEPRPQAINPNFPGGALMPGAPEIRMADCSENKYASSGRSERARMQAKAHLKLVTPTVITQRPRGGADVAKELGGHYIARTDKITPLDGAAPVRFIAYAFDSVEKAQAFNNTPYMKDVNAIRDQTTRARSFIVEGMPQ